MLDVVPGPKSVIGSIRVDGAAKVDTTFIRQLLLVKAGQRFRQRDLFQSQRKLYQTELFRLATVTIDSTSYTADSAVVPVAVLVSEGPFHRVRSGVGFATNDCFRGGAGWTSRNLFGTGRRFDLSGQVSKVGVGRPLDFGLDRSLCKSLKEDTIGSSRANYNVTASVRQHRFFTSAVAGTFSLFAERRSEFAVYRREDVGGSVVLTRETARRIPVSIGYRLSYGATQATAATFCAFFNACTPDDNSRLREKRLLGVVTAAVTWPRQNNPLDPTRGHFFAVEGSHSSRLTGSAPLQTFTRFSGDAAWYRPLGNGGTVLSWHLRSGVIFSPRVSLDSASGNFIPPEQRFYAGGPNDVRGYDLNGLGPVVYVVNAVPGDTSGDSTLGLVDAGELRPRFSPTGGNTLGIGQIELRVPSPVWTRRLRLAVFVDAGMLYERGKTNLAPVQVRFTPGVGIRINTPLGPARLDVGLQPLRSDARSTLPAESRRHPGAGTYQLRPVPEEPVQLSHQLRTAVLMHRHRLRWHILRLTVAVLLGFVPAILGTLTAVLYTETGNKTLGRLAGRELSRLLRGRFEIGQVSGSFLRTLELHDLVIRDTLGQPFAAVPRFRVSYSAANLLAGRFVFVSVELERPDVRIVKRQNGRLNYEEIFRLGEGPPGGHLR